LCGHLPLEPAADAIRWISILLAAGAVHLAIVFLRCRASAPRSRANGWLVLAVALLLRVTSLPIEPSLSDDAYRNVWDGMVQEAGIGAFTYPPSAPELGHLRDTVVWPKINHPYMRTVYPPTALLLGRLAAEMNRVVPVLPAMACWKIALLLVEAAGALFLLAGLRARGRSWAFPIYAWAPLPIFEFYVSGHADAAGVGLLAGAIGLYLLRRPARSGAFLAAAFLVKPVLAPVAAAWFVARRQWRLLAGAVLAAELLTIPYMRSGANAFESLRRYQAEWEFNGVLHRALRVDAWGAVPDRLSRGEWARLADEGGVEQKRVGRMIVAAAVPIGAAAALTGAGAGAVAVGGLGALLLLLPTLHPWYLTWLYPLLAWRRVRAFLVWPVLVSLVYEVQVTFRTTGHWTEDRTIQTVVLAPVLIILLIDGIRAMRRRGGARDGTPNR